MTLCLEIKQKDSISIVYFPVDRSISIYLKKIITSKTNQKLTKINFTSDIKRLDFIQLLTDNGILFIQDCRTIVFLSSDITYSNICREIYVEKILKINV